MKAYIKPGKYIVAVSGGVDSMVLLDLLKSHLPNPISQIPSPKSHLVVAHFDHGIRADSSKDCDFVASKAKDANLEFISAKGNLGGEASEATAREARYKFLNKAKDQYKAEAIVTAHHQDDVIETILINVIRGTGRKGLSSLQSNDKIIRPLLGYSKEQIISYAKSRGITWQEDPTNKDEKYLRNYLRQKILPNMSTEVRKKLLNISNKSKLRNDEIKEVISNITSQKNQLDRSIISRLDHKSSTEVVAEFLRLNDVAFDSKFLEKCVNFIKTAKNGKKFIVSNYYLFEVRGDKVKLNLL